MRACNVHANQDVNVCVLRPGMIREPYAPCTGNGKGLGVSNLSRSFGERSEHHLILYRTERKRQNANIATITQNPCKERHLIVMLH